MAKDVVSARLDKKELTLEDLILQIEAAITEVAGELDVMPKFDEGYGLTTEAVLEELDQLKRRERKLESRVGDYEQMTGDLRSQITALESELGGVSEERAAIQARMDAEAEVRAQFDRWRPCSPGRRPRSTGRGTISSSGWSD